MGPRQGTGRQADTAATQPAGGPREACADAIDRRYLARFTLSNAALEREVLELFASQAPLYLERLAGAETDKAWREAAHTIKGSALAVGAWRVARMAEFAEKLDIEVEALLNEGHRSEAVDAVSTAIEEACRYVARHFGGGSQRSGSRCA